MGRSVVPWSVVPLSVGPLSGTGLGRAWNGLGTPNGTVKIFNVSRPWDGGTPDSPPPARRKEFPAPWGAPGNVRPQNFCFQLSVLECCYLPFPECPSPSPLSSLPLPERSA